MIRSDHHSRKAAIFWVALLLCSLASAENVPVKRETKATPDPLFDQSGFDFHTYTATYDQPNRPQFHFTSQEGYINDPNGLIYYDGQWHLYFQHKGQKVWGHAVSTDLVHWKQLQHAIVMHKGHCADRGQIWSGTSIIDWNNTLGKQKGETKTIVAFFTHTQGKGFHQDGAYSTDKGRTFQLMGNLVPNQGSSKGERDPKVVWDPKSKKWIMILTAGCKEVFFSTDLVNWKHLAKYEGRVAGECPDLFQMPLDGETSKMKWVITNGGSQYCVGHLANGLWVADPGQRRHPFDYGKPRGNVGYAWQTFGNGPKGRVVQMGFIQNPSRTRKGQAPGSHKDQPFTQQMTFPVELTLRTTPSGIRLFRNPVKEIKKLYARSKTWANITVAAANDKDHLGGLSSDLMDMTCTFSPSAGDKVAFDIRGIKVRYSQSDGKIRIKNNVGVIGETTLPAGPDKKGKVKMRVLFDRTSFEIFVNDGLAVATLNCVPVGTKLSIAGPDKMAINELIVNELKSIWEESK